MKPDNWRTGLSFRLPMGDKISLELSRQSAQSRITVMEAWKVYEPITKRDNKSWFSDRARIKHLLKHLGNKQITALTLTDVERYRCQRLEESTVRKKRPSICSVNHEIKLLRRIINYVLRCSYIDKNPLTGLKLLKENNLRYRVITEEQLDRLVEVADDDLKPILVVAYDTGMRRGEILQLRWSQVDLRAGVVQLTETKTGYPRKIHLTDRAQIELASIPRSTSGYVFVNKRTNKPWFDIKKKWWRACRAADLEGTWFHDTRRSFVTNARRRGVPESVVMKMTGHRSREVFDRYNVISEEDLKGAIVQIQRGRTLENIPNIAA